MDTTPTTAEPNAPTVSKWTLPVLLAAQFVIPMSIAGTAIALPSVADSLGTQSTGLQWVVNGFNVSFAIFTLVWGPVSDRAGYRTTFQAGVAIALVGSTLSAFSVSLIMLDVARILAGIGAGAVITAASAIISNAYTGKNRAKAFAAFGTLNGLGLALGPSISGGLIAVMGWRGVFLAQDIVLLVALAGTVALPTLKHLTGGTHHKVIDLSLLRNREFAAMVLVPVAGAIGFVTVLTYLPSALTAILQLTAGVAGAVMLAMTLPVLIAPALVAQLTTRFHRVQPMHIILLSLVCLIVGDLALLVLRPGVSVATLLVPMLITGFGFGLPIGLVDSHALAAVPARAAGTAAGVLNLFRIGGEAVFVAAYAAILTALIHHQLPDSTAAARTAAGSPGHADAYAAALHPLLIILAVLVTVLTILVAWLHKAARHPSSGGADSSGAATARTV